MLVRSRGFSIKLSWSKRRKKPHSAVLCKSRGRDRTVLPNVSNTNEYSLASEQRPVLARAHVCVLVVFGTSSVAVCFSSMSPFLPATGSECDGVQSHFPAKRSRAKIVRRRRIEQRPLDCLTPIAVAKPFPVPEHFVLFPYQKNDVLRVCIISQKHNMLVKSAH